MNLSQFLENYASKWQAPEFDPKGMGRFEYTSNIAPSQYLKYAQADLESPLKHRYINALSNAKRAIDCQLDNIFEAFSLKKRRNFPEKLELIGELGLLAPRIVRKVVKVRNLLEHEYFDPKAEDVEDAVDVALLFLEATSRPFRSFMEDYFVADQASAQELTAGRIVSAVQNGENPINGYTFTESFYISFERDSCTFWIDCVHNNESVAEIEISSKHPFFGRMIRFAFDYDLDRHRYSEEEIGRAFISLMGDLAGEL